MNYSSLSAILCTFIGQLSLQESIENSCDRGLDRTILHKKLSDIHVKIRSKSDGKLVKNRVYVNRLKHGFLWHTQPPPNVDATEPAILADEEIPPNLVDNTEIPQGVDNVSQKPQNDSISEKLYEVENVLRKKCFDGKMVLPSELLNILQYYKVK